jgi:hypothetical protein
MEIDENGRYYLAWVDNNSGHYFAGDLPVWDNAFNSVGLPAFRAAGVIVPDELGY